MRLFRKRPASQPASAAYERQDSPAGDGEWIEHLDGTEWADADVPPWLHRCWPQTRARIDRELAERCACGAIRFDGYGPWVSRNRRKPQTEQEHAALLRQRDHADALDKLIREYWTAVTAEDWPRCTEIRAELRQLDAAMEAL